MYSNVAQRRCLRKVVKVRPYIDRWITGFWLLTTVPSDGGYGWDRLEMIDEKETRNEEDHKPTADHQQTVKK
jgi:hypothetical protein